MTLLMIICENGQKYVIKFTHIEMSTKDIEGQTAIIQTCHNGQTYIVKLEIDSNIDFWRENSNVSKCKRRL